MMIVPLLLRWALIAMAEPHQTISLTVLEKQILHYNSLVSAHHQLVGKIKPVAAVVITRIQMDMAIELILAPVAMALKGGKEPLMVSTGQVVAALNVVILDTLLENAVQHFHKVVVVVVDVTSVENLVTLLEHVQCPQMIQGL